MSRPVPAYCLHKPTGQSYATLRPEGKRLPIYFGRWGTAESVTRYELALTEAGFLPDQIAKAVEQARKTCSSAESQPLPSPTAPHTIVRNLWAAYWLWAQTYYRLPTGQPSRELENQKDAVRELLSLFGDRRVNEFTKADLEQVRQAMIDRQLSRGVINKRVNKIIRVFIWGTDDGRGLVAESVAATLRLIRPLQPHRSPAKEYQPVVGVDPKDVEKVVACTNHVVAAMMQLQLLTGMRPGEARGLRKRMVRRAENGWVADFGIEHKMAYRKQSRIVALGPKAISLLRQWLKECSSDDAFVFRPTQQKGSRGKLQQFTKDGYAKSVEWACDKAGVIRFTPNQIRHTAAEQIRKVEGLDAVQAVLGHKSRASSERYAPVVQELATKAAKRRG